MIIIINTQSLKEDGYRVDVYYNIFPTISTEDRRKEDCGDSEQGRSDDSRTHGEKRKEFFGLINWAIHLSSLRPCLTRSTCSKNEPDQNFKSST